MVETEVPLEWIEKNARWENGDNMCRQMLQEVLLRMGSWRKMGDKGTIFLKLYLYSEGNDLIVREK